MKLSQLKIFYGKSYQTKNTHQLAKKLINQLRYFTTVNISYMYNNILRLLMNFEEAKLQNISEISYNKSFNLPFITFLQQKTKYSIQSSKKRFLPYKSEKKKTKIREISNESLNKLNINNILYIKPHLQKRVKNYDYQKANSHKAKQNCCLLKQKQNDLTEKTIKKASRNHPQSQKLQGYSRYDIINAEKRYRPNNTNITDRILQPQLDSSFQQRLNAKQRVKKLLKTISFESRDKIHEKKPQDDLLNSYIQSLTNRRKVLQ